MVSSGEGILFRVTHCVPAKIVELAGWRMEPAVIINTHTYREITVAPLACALASCHMTRSMFYEGAADDNRGGM